MKAEQGATAPDRVRRENGRVWVEGVPAPRGTNSVLAALTSVLRSQGEDVTYEYLMGVSGRAFRLQFSWCPSAPHSCCGFNTLEPALEATGYSLKSYAMRRPDHRPDLDEKPEAEVAIAREAVRRSIDAGRAAMLGSEEAGILVGYEAPGAGRSGLLVRTDKDEPYFHPADKLPWAVDVLGPKHAPPPRRERILWSLRTAVANAHAPTLTSTNPTEEKPLTYAAGFAAWEKWIAELAGERKVFWDNLGGGTPMAIDDLPQDEWFGMCIGNAWCYESLVDARRAAAAYLRSVRGEFRPAAAVRLLRAADAYDRVVAALEPGLQLARYPWDLRERANWTVGMRRAQTRSMREALVPEREAIAEIEKALAAMKD